MSPAGDDRRYVRAIEAAWSKLTGRVAVVSPREFEAIETWRRRGIPLAVVLEVIGDAAKRRSRSAPRAITALSGAVEEAWAVVAAGRSVSAPGGAAPSALDAARAWEDVCLRSPEGAPLRTLLSRLLSEARTGTAHPILDDALDAALPGAVEASLLAEATSETDASLAPFRHRMSADEFAKLHARALADRLRTLTGLPRLALTR